MAIDLPIFLSRGERRAVTNPEGLTALTSDSSHPNPQTASSQTSLLKAPTPLTPVGSPRSILERAHITAGPSGGASRVQSLIDSGFNAATRPSNLALLLGGQIFFRSLCESRVVVRAAIVAPAVETGANLRWATLALPLAAVGCGDFSTHWNSSTGGYDASPPPDAGEDLSPDRDGDGYDANIDCDDADASIHPLPAAGGEVTINSSRTICPGTYRNVRIVIPPGTTGIALSGYSVTMDGDSSLQSAIRLEGVRQSQIEGFAFRNYRSGTGVISLFQSDNNTLRSMTADVTSGTWAVHLNESDSNLIEGWTINSHADRGIQIEASDRATVRANDVARVPPFDGLAWYGLLMIDGGTGHRVENNTFDSGLSHGICLYNLTDTTVINNEIFTNVADGIFSSSMRLSRIENNTVSNNLGYGLNLKNSSTQNQILNNNFTLNDLGAVTMDTSSATGNTFSGNTPAP